MSEQAVANIIFIVVFLVVMFCLYLPFHRQYFSKMVYPQLLYPKKRRVFRKRWAVIMTWRDTDKNEEKQMEWHHFTKLSARYSAFRSWRIFNGSDRAAVILLHRIKE